MGFFDWLTSSLALTIDVLIHLDHYLNVWVGTMGYWIYPLLALIVFAESGVVIAPFLPGDSLLFALGALTATPGSPLDPLLLTIVLTISALLGGFFNYSMGNIFGDRLIEADTRWVKKAYLIKT